MRTVTAGETLTLQGLNRVVTLRVKITNGSGTLKDLSTWVESVTIDQNIDQPVSSCTVEFRRDLGTTQSLSPLRTDSSLNVEDDGVTYAPQLDIGRSITVETATTVLGASIQNGDWKMLFKGTIDVVNFEASPVSIVCRDLGATLVDRWVETEKTYGTTLGRAVESVIQDVLDTTFGAGVVPLYTPVSPSFLVTSYNQQKMSVMDAIQALALLIGWDIRYKWDDGTTAFRLTLSEPPRSKSTPDFSFNGSAYYAIHTLNLDVVNIRNAIQVSYLSSSTKARATTSSTDATSITKYGRRFFLIQEADSSPINTSTEAQRLGDSVLSDLKEPKATQEVELPFFWPSDLGDLYGFAANSVHYNSEQDLAVATIRHEISAGHHRTICGVRGSPAGAYITWLAKGSGVGPNGAVTAPVPSIAHVPLTEIDDTLWELKFDCIPGSGGGGANLVWSIFTKKSFVDEALFATGDATGLPHTAAIPRDVQYQTDVRFECHDIATDLDPEAYMAVPAQNGEITQLGGVVLFKRTVNFNNGGFAANSSTNDGMTLHSSVVDSRSFAVNTHFNTAHHTIDDASDGATRKAVTSIDGAGKALIDFSQAGHTNKHLDNVADGTTYKRVTGVASNLITSSSSTPRNRCKVSNSANQATANLTIFNVLWDTELFDSNSLHSVSSATQNIVIPTGGDVGVWLFSAQIEWPTNATGFRLVGIRKAGTTVAQNVIQAAPTIATRQSVFFIDDAPAVGVAYDVVVEQSSGGALNVDTTAPGLDSFFSAIHLW